MEKKAGMMLSRSRVVGRFIIIENHRNQCQTNSRNESRSQVKDRYRGCFSRNRKVAPATTLLGPSVFGGPMMKLHMPLLAYFSFIITSFRKQFSHTRT